MNSPNITRIKRITESIISLPTLPTVVAKMIDIVDNPRTSAASLARLISSDQALTARILKLANSAYYGFPREITTVNMSIVVLGFNTVKDVGLSLSVFEVFKDTHVSPYFKSTEFWQHSIACGVAAKTVARRLLPRLAGEAFVSGLLHDIGKVILNQYMHNEFETIMKLAQEGQELDEAEMSVIATTHGQVGGWLAEKWNLPELITESIAYHHKPWDAPHYPVMVGIVTIANYLCHRAMIGNSGRPKPLDLDERLWMMFAENNVVVGSTTIDALLEDFWIEFDKTGDFFTLIQEEQD
ncbi:MAG: HDOD domain-containing protein [Chitinivibrionales bacterium]|nr:HDOD domain-containing protein [Chitinivibrionales bacterium]